MTYFCHVDTLFIAVFQGHTALSPILSQGLVDVSKSDRQQQPVGTHPRPSALVDTGYCANYASSLCHAQNMRVADNAPIPL